MQYFINSKKGKMTIHYNIRCTLAFLVFMGFITLLMLSCGV
jgi:hypothetical protein